MVCFNRYHKRVAEFIYKGIGDDQILMSASTRRTIMASHCGDDRQSIYHILKWWFVDG